MFPNIDNEKGLNACKNRLNERELLIPSTECILDALEIVLTNNISKFEDLIFRQCSGAAMGPACSCSYCDITVDEIIDRIVMDPNINSFKNFLELYSRLRDDIYALWFGTVEQLHLYNKWLNSLDDRLKFEMKFSRVGIEYLEIFIYTRNNKIETKIWSKPCDPHSYLLPTSYHPVHTCESIPYSVLSKVKRLCSREEDFCPHSRIMKIISSNVDIQSL